MEEERLLWWTARAVATLAAVALCMEPAQAAQDVVASPVRFAPRIAIPVAPHAHSVEADDLNGDGHLDLMVATAATSEVAVLLGKGDGSFNGPRYFAVGKAPKSVATGDFNRDGKRDIIVAEQDSNSVGVLLGRGDGTFDERVGYDSCVGDHEILVADLDADAIDDAAVACWGRGNLGSIFPGIGDGTFSQRQDLVIGSAPHSVDTADFNGDGHADLVFSNQGSNTISVLISQAGEGFQPLPELPVGQSPHGVRIADLDGDGHLDIVAANSRGNSVSVLWGTLGGFEPHVDLPALSLATSIAAADVNGDGRKDLLVTHTTYPNCCSPEGSTLRVYVNAGNRQFLDPEDFFVGGNPFSLWTGDLNGDGRTDVATANYMDLPAWVHAHSTLAAVFDARYGSRSGKVLRLGLAAVLGLLIVAATWRRRRVAGLAAAFLLVAGYTALLLWIRSQKDMSHVTILMGS